ncbi:MAG: S8 family serine peptidase [Gemmatimonadota bacterium]|nr:S8 family serine peptidase [Gemmatimonadota bacterium]MDP7032557.1 S8 family serine peptidase [Gemmatimonadota bacterium]
MKHSARVLAALWIAALAAGCGVDQGLPTAPDDPARSRISSSTGGSHGGGGGDLGGGSMGITSPQMVVPDSTQFVVKMRPGADPEALVDMFGLEIVYTEACDGGVAVLYNNPAGVDISQLDDYAGVEEAATNREVYLLEGASLVIGFYEGEWDDGTAGDQDALARLELPRVHALATGAGVRVAVLDTGVDADHRFLKANLELLPGGSTMGSLETKNGIDDDGDGYVDEAYGHGTHVSGIALQVAPGITIIPIKVLNDEGMGSFWDLVRAMEITRKLGADIVNLSLSLSEPVEMFDRILSDCVSRGVPVVAAAGNAGWGTAAYPGTSPMTLGAAAVDSVDALAEFSGGGPEIHVAAPGVRILSCYPGQGMASASGTSMATPATVGSVAILVEGLGLAPITAAHRVAGTTDPVFPGSGVLHGRISPLNALTEK